jgi:hypothetical protein
MNSIFPISENLIKKLSDDLKVVLEEVSVEEVKVVADKPSTEK